MGVDVRVEVKGWRCGMGVNVRVDVWYREKRAGGENGTMKRAGKKLTSSHR